MYIPTFGLLPNSRYVPIKFLNAGGFVTVDEFLNVKGKGNGIDTASLKDVWALGDVSDLEYAQFVSCDKQSVYLAKNVILALRADNNRPPLPYKAATKRTLLLSALPVLSILLPHSFSFFAFGYILLHIPWGKKI